FHADALAEIRRGAEVPVSSLVEQVDEQAIAVARELGAAGIGPSIKGLSLRAAEAVHEAGMAVNPWTVNTVAQLEVALACGADTITPDDRAWVQRGHDVRLGRPSRAPPASESPRADVFCQEALTLMSSDPYIRGG